jgi:hypothetical protein
LQIEELAKAKGVPKEWQPPSRNKRKLWRTVVSSLTVVNLWTVAMDSLRDWMRSLESKVGDQMNQEVGEGETESLPSSKWEDSTSKIAEWEVPNLREDSEWHEAHVYSLRQAIQKLPNPQRHFKNGIQALA